MVSALHSKDTRPAMFTLLLFVLCSMMSLTVVDVAKSSSDFTCLMPKSRSVATGSVILVLLLM